MREPIWLDRLDCVAIHEMMLVQHGGVAGVRDSGLLDSALSRPRQWFAYGKPTMAALPASYAGGVILNHPFVDGNKRTGFMLAATFLEVNGRSFTASEEEVYRQTLGFAAKELDEAAYAAWLAKNCIE